tara:strand:+ start:1100 stop:1954 length:855 start_codon:yes stop_codon:yes gene_type:complete
MEARNKGLLLSLVGVLILSPDSLLIRLVNLDDYSLIFYRSALPVITIFLFLFYIYKFNLFKSFILIGNIGIFYALLYAITHVCFVYSIQNTSVANTLVLIAAAPIFAAIFSIFILKEIPNFFTWIIIFIALLGMIIIGWGSYTTSGFFGDLMALIVALGMGFSMVIVRYYKNIDLVPACLIGCIIAALYALPFDINFSLNSFQVLILLIMCLIILPIPFIILTIAPKYAHAHEVALIFLMESVLGTAWVWFVINEVPPINTIIGGIILLIAVSIFIVKTTREKN